jgi:hypothetical protein
MKVYMCSIRTCFFCIRRVPQTQINLETGLSCVVQCADAPHPKKMERCPDLERCNQIRRPLQLANQMSCRIDCHHVPCRMAVLTFEMNLLGPVPSIVVFLPSQLELLYYCPAISGLLPRAHPALGVDMRRPSESPICVPIKSSCVS